MANHSVAGQTQRFDRSQQRIAAGTVGGEHAIPSSIPGTGVAGFVDDSDSRVTYGTFDGTTFTAIDQDTMVTNNQLYVNYAYNGLAGGTNHVLRAINVACKFKFTGTQISVLVGLNAAGANFKVYIDGQLAKGRLAYFSPLATYTTNISATDTTIPVLTTATLFSGSNEICIGNEIISYTTKDAYTLYGCTRGLYGTTATSHDPIETVFSWSDTPNSIYGTDYFASRRVAWSNHLLTPGEHEIIIVQTGSGNVAFDGFLTSETVSGKNIRTFIDTWQYSGTTDVNGFMEIGVLSSLNPEDVIQIGYLGHTQTTPTTAAGASTLGKLAVRATGTSSLPYYYYHGGPASVSVTVAVYAIYIGGTSI